MELTVKKFPEWWYYTVKVGHTAEFLATDPGARVRFPALPERKK
jgi:hypothetical protein